MYLYIYTIWWIVIWMNILIWVWMNIWCRAYIQYFLYLDFLYLAEAIITMPGPRNHNSVVFNLAAGTFWEWSVCEMQAFYYHYFFSTKIQKSAATAAGFWILLDTITSFIPKLKIQNSAAAAAGFWVSLATITSLIPKFKNRPRQRPNYEFWILLSTITFLIPEFKTRPRQWPNFEFC